MRVLERHQGGGQRFRGDMHGLENWPSPDDGSRANPTMGYRSRVRPLPLDIVTCYDSQLRAVVAHTTRPMFYLLLRGSGPGGTLDSALLAQSRKAGDEVRFGVHRREVGPESPRPARRVHTSQLGPDSQELVMEVQMDTAVALV